MSRGVVDPGRLVEFPHAVGRHRLDEHHQGAELGGTKQLQSLRERERERERVSKITTPQA